MADDIYSKLEKQPRRYRRGQFIDDIKLLRKRQQELARKEDYNNSSNYFQKNKRKKRQLVNIIKLPSSKTNNDNLKRSKRNIYQRSENISNEYFEKQRLQNKNRIAQISTNINKYKQYTPQKLTMPNTSQLDTQQTNAQQIKIKIKTPNKVRKCSPRNKHFKFDIKSIHSKQYQHNQNNLAKLKTKKINKKRLVSPMYFKRYNGSHNEIKNNKDVKIRKPKTRSNQQKQMYKKKKFKTRKINVGDDKIYDIDTNIIKEKLERMHRYSLINILVNENLVKRTTRAPKKLLIDLLLTTKMNYINVLKE